MSDRGNNNTPLLIIGIALLAFGGWALLGAMNWGGAIYIREAFSTLSHIGWPLLLVAAGVLLIIAANKPGGFSVRVAGKTLRRSRGKRVISGVFGGLSDYIDVDVAILRIVGVLLLITNAFPVTIAYLVATVAIPEEPMVSGESPAPAPPIPPAPPAPPQG